MQKKRAPLFQLIAYQRQLGASRQQDMADPAQQWRARLGRESGLRSKILKITFDFWYPLVETFGPRSPETARSVSTTTVSRPHFSHLDLAGADLTGANLAEFDLIGLDLRGSNLVGAVLSEADLSWADLRGANLQRTNLEGAYLYEARLGGANLSEARLGGADLRGAAFSETTIWPAGLDPEAAGAVKTT